MIAAMLVFKLSCKLAMCYAGGKHWKKANSRKLARQNIEKTLLKVHYFSNLELSAFYNNFIPFDCL